ncbi:Protein kinase-like protein [Melia azedarach]|uniref:Protein kinase-like protein n=1 Tax=Melia azedarach TaxID=155640 RepID=A0ACC1Z1N0_MELAZ|nr:Protein kinase-like protein [Melia azedarach]
MKMKKGRAFTTVEDSRESPRERLHRKESLNKHVVRVSSSRREEIGRSRDRAENNDVKVMLIDKKTNGSNRYYDHHKIEKFHIDDQIERKMIHDQIEKKKKTGAEIERKKTENPEVNVLNHPGVGRLPKAAEGEQVAAGWPYWLAAVAGEAIKGWIPRRANTFEKLDKIGQGTYSSVYRARDVIHDKIVALKKVRFDNHDPESVKFMAREIAILRSLDHPNIIKLEGLITSQTSCSLYLVFEYMEHDLVGIASLPGTKFTESQVKCYMKQLLSGLEHCHSHGVLHRDIKGSNLLIDDNGVLKIADFGLASFFNPKDSGSMTSRVVTLWYRPPELLLGASHYGAAVDLWSAGCILGELFAGKPILPGKTEVEQLHRIFKLCGSPSEDYWRKSKLHHSTVFKPVQPYRRRIAETFRDFPATALGLMETLLSIDPAHRGTAACALNSEFFTAQPLACDPSSMPKYPPSKEIDAKLRDEESRRQRVAGIKDRKGDLEGSWRKEYLAIPAPNANGELATSMQRKHHTNSRSKNEMIISHKEVTSSVNPHKQPQAVKEASKDLLEHQRKKVSYSGPLVHGTTKVSHSGPLVHGTTWAKAGKGHDDPPVVSTRSNLSTLSGFVASRTVAPKDRLEKFGPSQLGTVKQVGGSQRSYNDLVSAGKQDYRHNNQRTAESPQGFGKATIKEPNLHGRGPRGNKIYVSGPLFPSNNVDQLLKEHDRHLQEFARRARLDKTKPTKVHA